MKKQLRKPSPSPSRSPLKSITAADLALITGGGLEQDQKAEGECKAGDETQCKKKAS
jgi:hypothetical protein